MCGIHASISRGEPVKPSQSIQDLLIKRGPDHIGQASTQVEISPGASYQISITSTVLALRGGHVTRQPFQSSISESLFCWNGEVWKIDLQAVNGNDGQALFELLGKASSQVDPTDAQREVLKVLRGVSGPFAFFFLDKVHSRIYYGRDRLGRRSLLFRQTDDHLEVASISCSQHADWREVEADGIYSISLAKHSQPKDEDLLTSTVSISLHRWNDGDSTQSFLGNFNKQSPTLSFLLDGQTASIHKLREHLTQSLALRILNIPTPPGLDEEHNARIAILFSGGLDCTVLARMAHDILPKDQQIDLINVAFENPRVVQAAAKLAGAKKPSDEGNNAGAHHSSSVVASPYEICPDRETGRKAFRELQDVCPGRLWRFVAVNIPYAETVAHRSTVVGLIHPHNTEMDLSIAYALYFAARGRGHASNSSDLAISYETSARVLLSGLGADELFGGYTRHATAFSRSGYEGLLDELELDVNRLGKRNLGRDDRVISHWGKEARFPYLDEDLVRWAVECPIQEKCGFGQQGSNVSDIEPGKKVLRLLAVSLGMHGVAREKKRAIQFGARTAKMEVGRTKGTHVIS